MTVSAALSKPDAASTDQDWGIALLFAVWPSDRALTGWGLAGVTARYLELLAARANDEPR